MLQLKQETESENNLVRFLLSFADGSVWYSVWHMPMYFHVRRISGTLPLTNGTDKHAGIFFGCDSAELGDYGRK